MGNFKSRVEIIIFLKTDRQKFLRMKIKNWAKMFAPEYWHLHCNFYKKTLLIREQILVALTNRMPVKCISDERRDMGELSDAPYETGSSFENRLKFRCIS